jgi:hypothetical protein
MRQFCEKVPCRKKILGTTRSSMPQIPEKDVNATYDWVKGN